MRESAPALATIARYNASLMTTHTRTRIFRRLAAGALALIVLGALLALDLANRGLAWQFFWSQTGEETPLAQVRGMVEWAGNLTRPQPQPDPLIPIQHAGVNPYGVNTFLNQEVEVEKVEAQLRMIAEAGFGWIRQEFPWQDIEIHGRGDFEDRRNVEAVGVIDAWAKYDRIVDLAEQYGIQIQARISAPPAWSRAEVDLLGLGPPDDFQDYVSFAVAVAERYRGRLRYFQIWNEPNIYPEWGTLPDGAHKPVDPAAYAQMLCRTHDALKALDPQIVVISAAMAPTSALTDRDLNDFVYWQRLYDAGAGACFDVLSMQGYGLNSGPTDRRMRPTTVTFARNLYIRDLMVANGDAHKPIWISEAAWNYVPTREEAPDIAEPREAYGQVTPEEAARYMPLAYQRAQAEWPWVGVMNYWFFTLPDQSRINESFYYFRLVDTDYNPDTGRFTPMPVYDALKAYITEGTPTLYQGVHQADAHWAIMLDTREDCPPQTVAQDDAGFGQAAQTCAATFTAYGTDVLIRWQGTALSITGDGSTQTVTAAQPGWQTTQIASRLLPTTFTLSLRADAPFTLDTVTVLDRTFENVFPLAGVGVALLLALAALIVWERR